MNKIEVSEIKSYRGEFRFVVTVSDRENPEGEELIDQKIFCRTGDNGKGLWQNEIQTDDASGFDVSELTKDQMKSKIERKFRKEVNQWP